MVKAKKCNSSSWIGHVLLIVGVFLFCSGLINLISTGAGFWAPFSSWIFWGLIVVMAGKCVMHPKK